MSGEGGVRGSGLGTLAVESQFAPVVAWVSLKGRFRELPVLGSEALQSSAEGKNSFNPGALVELRCLERAFSGTWLFSESLILYMGYYILGMQGVPPFSLFILSSYREELFLQRGALCFPVQVRLN